MISYSLIALCQENENEVSNNRSSVNSNNNSSNKNSTPSESEITAVWYNSNDTSSKEFPSNRENIKKEFTNKVEHFVQKESLSENVSTSQIKQVFRKDRKPSNPSCSTDEIGISIDESRAVRFRNNLFVVS